MAAVRAYEPRRFKSAVPFYERYRLGYPERLLRRVLSFAALVPGDRVLDLGTGPGLLAIPFAAAGLRVSAADPEPDMLDAAADAARSAGVTLELLCCSSYDLTPSMGPYRLVTMGRAFHWMDRPATLRMLDRIVAPRGAIALFHDHHPDTTENRWTKVLREIGDRHGRSAEPHVAERRADEYRTHESVLLASAFKVLDGISVTIQKPITVDEIVGRAFSMSTCSREKLGTRAGAFEAELRAGLALLSASGEFSEIAKLEALVARRP
ncbi:MAG TPA: class I SAM-dependent methyltransferase [Steroidobacteraceae bacterium]|nr:class I SAM-dependent methyltransferase [Steroidobacteraceae bacterium]